VSLDPTVIRSLAVTAEDVVAALETNLTSDREAVLRVTPPFSGRMRARLHLRQGDGANEPTGPVHVPPETLLEPDPPAYPRPADTEARLRDDSDREYTVERHRERHVEAVDAWRMDVRGAIRGRATLETHAGPVDVDVSVLG